MWGRPLDGAARKYLLTGLARCGQCGGSLEVRSRSHGEQRAFFYACSSYYRRRKTICPNRLEIPLPVADATVIKALQDELMTPTFIETVVRKVVTRTIPTGQALDETRARLRAQLAEVQGELDRLVEGLARSGVSPAVTTAIRRREARKTDLDRELAGLDQCEQLSHVELTRLEALAKGKAAEWRALLGRHTPQARQILSKVLRDKLVFRPERRGKLQGYRFIGEGTITTLLTGLIPDLSQAVASPTGFVRDRKSSLLARFVRPDFRVLSRNPQNAGVRFAA